MYIIPLPDLTRRVDIVEALWLADSSVNRDTLPAVADFLIAARRETEDAEPVELVAKAGGGR